MSSTDNNEWSKAGMGQAASVWWWGEGVVEEDPVLLDAHILRKRHIPVGSMVNMQKQDPSVKTLGYRPVWIHDKIYSGPRTAHIVMRGVPRVPPSDLQNNYLYDSNMEPQKCDIVNAFCVVNHVRTMYQRALRRMKSKVDLKWNWGPAPIQIFPLAGEWANAFYSRDKKALAFFFFNNPNTNETVYTCRSFDVITHETGHAILDGFKPQYITSTSPQTGALHESFGDLTSIFAALELLDVCESVIALSKCDLRSRNLLSLLAEEFGTATGQRYALRNANNNLKLEDVTDEVHDLSRVFTGAVYSILAEIFELSVDVEKIDPSETLYRVGKRMVAVTITGFLNAPDRDAQFRDIAESMVAAEPLDAYKKVMMKHFTQRSIFNRWARPRRASVRASGAFVCGTMELYCDAELASTIGDTHVTCENNEVDEVDGEPATSPRLTRILSTHLTAASEKFAVPDLSDVSDGEDEDTLPECQTETCGPKKTE